MLSQTGRGHRLDMVTDLTLIFKILNKKNVEGQKDGVFFGGGVHFVFGFFLGGKGDFLRPPPKKKFLGKKNFYFFFGGGGPPPPPQKKIWTPPKICF